MAARGKSGLGTGKSFAESLILLGFLQGADQDVHKPSVRIIIRFLEREVRVQVPPPAPQNKGLAGFPNSVASHQIRLCVDFCGAPHYTSPQTIRASTASRLAATRMWLYRSSMLRLICPISAFMGPSLTPASANLVAAQWRKSWIRHWMPATFKVEYYAASIRTMRFVGP